MPAQNRKIVGGGEMARLIRGYDWGSTSIGPMSSWPQSLVTSVNLMLQTPVPIVMLWGADGVMIYNDGYSVFAGRRHPKLLGSIVVEGWPEVADFNRTIMDTVYRQGRVLEYEGQHLTLYRSGGDTPDEVWMDLSYSPIIDESGMPGGVMAIVIETTQRLEAERRQKSAEASLRLEQRRLHSMLMQAPAAIAILRGPNHVIELANPPYVRLVGQSSLIGKTVREAMPEVEAQGFLKILDDVYAHDRPYSGNEVAVELGVNRQGTPRRRYVNFVYQPYHDPDESVAGILVHAVDVTDLVVSRHRFEEIASLNKSITDNATTGLIIMDTNQFCTFMNPAAEKIMGLTFSYVKKSGKPLHYLAHYKRPDGSPYPIEDCPTTKAIPRRGRVPAEDMFVRPDGTMYPVAVMSSPLFQDGQPIGTVIEFRDITKEKEAERRVRELNKDLESRVQQRTRELTVANQELGRSNEELQDFAYVASHDLQEPLRKITAFTNLLESDLGDQLSEDTQLYLRGLQKSSGRMRTLISDLLTYSRVTTQAQPFKSVSLRAAVSDALEDLQARIDDTHATVTYGRLATVQADPLQLRLLLQNLIGNAMKYARPGAAPNIRIRTRVVAGWCSVYVEDNGIGFDERYLDRIFTIFQRLHGKSEYEGTGVGLAICKKIVERHGGTITARSTPGVGSTFIIRIPVKQGKTA